MADLVATVAFDIIHFGAIIGAITVIILDSCNLVKTMAWILMLMFLPLVGLVLYFLLGRSQCRVCAVGKKNYNRLLKKSMAEYLAQDSYTFPINYNCLISLFRSINQAFPFDGNRVEIYAHGLFMLQALLYELQNVTKHIHIGFYILKDDVIGRMARDVLIDEARQGVEVRVIYDGVGCWHIPNRSYEQTYEAGVEMHSLLKVRFLLFTNKASYRDHCKIIVADERIGFIGSMNLAECHMYGFFQGIWRGAYLLLEGKVVHGLQTVFLLDWHFVNHTSVTSIRYSPRVNNYGTSLT